MSLKKFFIHYSHFFTGSALSLMLGLISFPILTRVLTREEYGTIGLIATTMLLTVAMAKTGLSDGIVRFYNEYSENPEKLEVFSSTVIARGALLATAVTSIYILVFVFLRDLVYVKPVYVKCYLIMAAYLWVRPLNVIVMNILMVRGKTVFYNAVNLIGRITSIIGSLVLMFYVFGEFYGYFIGLVLSELIVSAVLFGWFFSTHRFRTSKISGDLAIKLIRFGLPLLITELSYLLLSYADRYMLVAYKGEDSLGLYTVGYNLSSYISDMIMFSLAFAVVPMYVKIYEKEGREKTEAFLSGCMNYLVIAVITVFFGYLAVSKELFVALASEKYASASSFSPIILFGALLLGMNNIFNAGLYLSKRSRTIFVVMLAALAVNIVMNLILLPAYGVMGAAVATLAACAVSSALTVVLSSRHIRVKVELKTVLYYTASAFLMYLLLSRIELKELWAGIGLKILAGASFMSAFILYREKELLVKIKMLNPLKSGSC